MTALTAHVAKPYSKRSRYLHDQRSRPGERLRSKLTTKRREEIESPDWSKFEFGNLPMVLAASFWKETGFGGTFFKCCSSEVISCSVCLRQVSH
jgi:hypothetical protein